MQRHYEIRELRLMPWIELIEVAFKYDIADYPYHDVSHITLMRRILLAQRVYFDREFEVEMRAFQAGVIRPVRVPSRELTGEMVHDLERVFYWGQNDFQPVAGRCSVSCGDVIRFDGNRFWVAPMGFEQLVEGELTR